MVFNQNTVKDFSSKVLKEKVIEKRASWENFEISVNFFMYSITHCSAGFRHNDEQVVKDSRMPGKYLKHQNNSVHHMQPHGKLIRIQF